MGTMKSWRIFLFALGLLWTVAFIWPTASLAAGKTGGSHPTLFSGRAVVVQATVLGLQITQSDTGELDSTGGEKNTSLLQLPNLLPFPNSLTAEVLSASTMGSGRESTSRASVANLNLTLAGNTISADVLMARATANCTKAGPALTGRSDVASLVINGNPIIVTGEPNQTVNLVVGQIIINEQASSVSGNFGVITVNALHVKIPGVADVVISQAKADITCGGAVCPVADFMTGGGFITSTPSGAKGTFGLVGGIKPNGVLDGHLTYIDHGPNGPKVKGTSVLAYSVVNATTRHIEYGCQVTGGPIPGSQTCVVDVADNGEPGRNDTFSISFPGYIVSGTLAGGNIQLHRPNDCSK